MNVAFLSDIIFLFFRLNALWPMVEAPGDSPVQSVRKVLHEQVSYCLLDFYFIFNRY